MAELLLELFSEEIPARMQDRAAEDLKALVLAELARAGLEHGPSQAFATPRRLTLVVDGVPARQPDRSVERRGPRADAPEAARKGFLNSLGSASYRLEEREEKKGRVVYALLEEQGRGTSDVLAGTLPELLARFPWPKSMRSGDGETRWVRPLQSILCLLDDAVVPFAFAGIQSGDETRGHRFLAPEPFRVRGFAEYRAKLDAAKVVLDPAQRHRIIADEATRLAEREGLRLKPDEGLLDELKGLVEWPMPLMGRIDAEFMALPSEVLTTSMRTHQRYLALEDGEGRLAPRFITVANIQAPDGGAAIIAGNERVLRARLWDARFFWEQDQKRSLWDWKDKLDDVVFHEDLGRQGERIGRIVALACELTSYIDGTDKDLVSSAGWRAKSDLATGMVGEFPELQGIIGGYYARNEQLPDAVCLAISEHYAPRGPNDLCPSAPTSVAVALADRLDTLAGFFAAGIKPTGSKDPFALRRAALGVIRLIVENNLRLPLKTLIKADLSFYKGSVTAPIYNELEKDFTTVSERVQQELLRFFADRLKVHLRGEGVRHDLVTAVFAAGEEDDLVRLLARVEALSAFLATEDGRNLLTAYRRASNIVGIEEKRDGRAYTNEPELSLLRDPAEQVLYEALVAARERIDAALKAEEYQAAMAALAALRAPVDAFFAAVMVNVEDRSLRANRLQLLALIRSALGQVADFGLIEDAAA